MAYPKGGPKVGGRKKGTPNKTTAAIKELVVEALDRAGGVEYLVAQSESNPTAFLTLVGKIVPLQMDHDVSKRLAKALTWKRPT